MMDFSKIQTRAFTKQFTNYKKKNPQNKTLKDLEDFAHFIIQYPSKFTKIAKKRAELYLNVEEHKKLSHSNNIMGRKKSVLGGDVLDDIKGGLEKAGEPFKTITGVNPATLGYDLGHDVIGPAIFGRGVHVHHHHYHPVSVGANMVAGFIDDMRSKAKKAIQHAVPVIKAGAKRVVKKVAPELIDEGATKLKEFAGDNNIAHQIIDKGAKFAKNKIEGLGVKRGRFVKGSAEAKEYMRKIREMRKK